MLGLMRRHSRSVVIKLVYAGLILSFLLWGIGSYQSKKEFIAVSVNGDEIKFQEYERSFENLINYYKETMKDGFNDELIVKLNLKKRALDSLIDRILLLQEGKKLKIKPGKEEISKRIQNYPAFQKDGKFDKETYFRVLSRNNIKPGDFEEEQKGLLLMGRVEETIKRGASISDVEVLEGYRRENTTVNLEFIKITPEQFEKKAKPVLKEMKDYFTAHVGEFIIPEKIMVGNAIFDPKDFLKEIKLTKEDYDDYYKSYIDDFMVPPKVRARHILIKFDNDKEEDRKEAQGILERIKKGEGFSKLAKKYSDDSGSAKKGGDLGFFSMGEMVKPFEDAAFSMEKGEVSDLVESIYGFHIIKVEDVTEEKTKPLSEVKGVIRNILEVEISRELAEGRAEDIYYEALQGKNIEELVREEKLPYNKTALFTLDNIPPALEEIRGAVQEASTMDVGWMDRPREGNERFHLLTLLKKEPPREPNFEEVKREVKKAVAREMAKKEAVDAAEKILSRARKGASLKKLAKERRLKVEETDSFSITRNFVPNLGVSQEIVSKAFELTVEKPLADKVYKVGNTAVIFSLKERKEMEEEAFEKEKDSQREKLLNQRREEFYRQWLQEARGKAEIVYHEDLEELRG